MKCKHKQEDDFVDPDFLRRRWLQQAVQVSGNSLVALEIGGNGQYSGELLQLLEALKHNTSIKRLQCTRVANSEEFAAALADCIRVNSCIISLDLTANEWNDNLFRFWLKSLGHASALSNVLHFNLSFNRLGSAITTLCDFLVQHRSLKTLILNETGLGDSGANCVSALLRSHPVYGESQIQTLSLVGNNIRHSALVSLAGMLTENRSLTTLDLGDNPFGNSGATHIATALTVNTTLLDLSLRRCGMQMDGFRAIGTMLSKNSSLRHLNLVDNFHASHWWMEGAVMPLVQGLKCNRSLTLLCLTSVEGHFKETKEAFETCSGWYTPASAELKLQLVMLTEQQSSSTSWCLLRGKQDVLLHLFQFIEEFKRRTFIVNPSLVTAACSCNH